MLFYIDIYNGVRLVKDDIGSDVENFGKARREAIEALQELVDDRLPDDDHRCFLAIIRDHNRTELYRVELTFEGYRIGNDTVTAPDGGGLDR